MYSTKPSHSNKRGETVMVGMSMHLLGYVFNRIFTELNIQGVSYFGVVWTQTFGTFSHPLNIAWMSLACTDSEERALAMAMVISGANIAGIYGAQIFRSDDSPRYRRGFGINIGVLTLGLALATVRFVDDKWFRRVVPAQASEDFIDEPSGSEKDTTEPNEKGQDGVPTLNLEKQPQQPLGINSAAA